MKWTRVCGGCRLGRGLLQLGWPNGGQDAGRARLVCPGCSNHRKSGLADFYQLLLAVIKTPANILKSKRTNMPHF